MNSAHYIMYSAHYHMHREHYHIYSLHYHMKSALLITAATLLGHRAAKAAAWSAPHYNNGNEKLIQLEHV